MSEPGDGLTYIDVEAWTYNSDTQASNLAKMSFERVKLVADDCTMSISGDDYRFSTQKPLGVTTYPEEARINGSINENWDPFRLCRLFPPPHPLPPHSLAGAYYLLFPPTQAHMTSNVTCFG